ncbi:srg family chemoreceptor domain-containing protein [Ditylenchus destructor]|uniref:Serpentine receptor class gamma n=1 Tax=Ditylenchus destructor TaxID=166010 RepID=A0AAD4QWS8_9BILA|nr:srg family chemoreceptor domain-containing protein [Ditylenchus destructor]
MGVGTWLASTPLPPFIIGLVIGVPSVILYLIEAIILIKHWTELNSSFFRLFLVRFTLNFLNYICSYMYARLGRVGLFYELFQSSPSVVLAIWFTFYYYAFHAENLTTMFILINRLTSILFPLNYIKIWKHLLPLSVMVIVLVPLPFTAPMLTYGFSVRLQADNYTFTLAPNDGPNPLEPSLVSAISAIIFCVICGALNIATLIVYNLKVNDENRSDKLQQKIESKLTIYALITFLGHLFMALYMIAILFCCIFGDGWDFMFLATLNQLPWISDFSTIVVPSWVLLWASNTIRELVTKELRLQEWPMIGQMLLKSKRKITFVTVSSSRSGNT